MGVPWLLESHANHNSLPELRGCTGFKEHVLHDPLWELWEIWVLEQDIGFDGLSACTGYQWDYAQGATSPKCGVKRLLFLTRLL